MKGAFFGSLHVALYGRLKGKHIQSIYSKTGTVAATMVKELNGVFSFVVEYLSGTTDFHFL